MSNYKVGDTVTESRKITTTGDWEHNYHFIILGAPKTEGDDYTVLALELNSVMFKKLISNNSLKYDKR